MSRYQKGKANLDFTEARDSEWQWHQLGHMQVCTSLQTNNHASTPPLSFFTGRMPFLPPNQQRQSTEGTVYSISVFYFTFYLFEGWGVRVRITIVMPTTADGISTKGRIAGGHPSQKNSSRTNGRASYVLSYGQPLA